MTEVPLELPLELPTGRVVGRFIFEVQDNNDPGEEPQLVPVTGDVTIKSSIDNLRIFDPTLGTFITFRGPHKAIVNRFGELSTPDPVTNAPMYSGMSLWSNDSDKLSVKGWTYTATFNLKTVDGKTLNLQPVTFTLATGQEVDLADVVQVPSTPGYGLPQAEGAALRAEAAATSAADDAAQAEAAADRAELVAGATDAGVAILLSTAGTSTRSELDSRLATKVDLVGGKVPVAQLPTDALVTDANVAAVVNGAQTGPAIDLRINTQVTPVVEQVAADYIASQPAVVDAAAAAVDADPKIVELENRPLGRHLNVDENLDSVLTVGDYYVDADSEATLALGFPVARAGKLRVDRFRPSDASLVQIYYPFRHAGFFIRYLYQSLPYTGAPYGPENNGWAEYRTWKEVQSAIASAIASVIPPARSSTTSLVCIGDSLTAGYSSGAAWVEADSYPAKLGAYLGAGVTVTKRGFTGATTDQINLRVGALPLEVKIPGGSIPASGSVALTSKQVIGGWGGTVSFNAYGYLDGVYGLLQYTEAGGYTFTRSGSGAAVTTPRATFLGEFKQHTLDTIIYGAGRNDITKNTTGMEATVADHVIRGYTEIMNYASPTRKQVVLLGTITRTNETPGSAGFEAVQEIATRSRALWPANFADLQGYLTGSKVWADTGITPTQADLDAQALGMTPPSLFDDETHYSRATAAAIGGSFLGAHLEQKGYV